MTNDDDTRMQRLGYRAPGNVPEPDELVLVEYVSGGRVAIITLNRPHADNAITTELAAQLIEILETIAARPPCAVAIITGAGDRAFSVGGDLYQRKQMTKENGCVSAWYSIAFSTRCASYAGRSSPQCMGWPTAAVARSPSARTSSSPPTRPSSASPKRSSA